MYRFVSHVMYYTCVHCFKYIVAIGVIHYMICIGLILLTRHIMKFEPNIMA